MGIAYNTSIVRNGLVLHLDAANKKSYPGTGTAWNDLSGNGNISNLINGVTNSNNSMIFDGTNDYVELQNDIFLESQFTISITFKQTEARTDWVRLIGHSNDTTNRFWGIWIPSNRSNLLWQSYNNGGQYTSPVVNFELNKTYRIDLTSNGAAKTFYVNGNFLGSTSSGGLIDYSTNVSKIRIGYAGFHTYHKGDVYSSEIYNRTLTSDEIRKNFEAFRGRYGI